MRKKLLTATVGGASALALGAGLFAWSATNVTIAGVDSAGAADQTDGCLVGDLILTHNDPIYDTALSEWFITGVNVLGDDGSNATACAGYTLKVSYETLAGATVQVGTVENLPDAAAFSQAVAVVDGALPGVPSENISNWQVVIADASGVVVETFSFSHEGNSYFNFMMYTQGTASSSTWSASFPILGYEADTGNYTYLSTTGWANYKSYASAATFTPNADGSILITEGNGRDYVWRNLASDPTAGPAEVLPLP